MSGQSTSGTTCTRPYELDGKDSRPPAGKDLLIKPEKVAKQVGRSRSRFLAGVGPIPITRAPMLIEDWNGR